MKDLHQISPHHCLNKELLLRLQQGTCASADTSWRRRLFLAHLLVCSFVFVFFLRYTIMISSFQITPH